MAVPSPAGVGQEWSYDSCSDCSRCSIVWARSYAAFDLDRDGEIDESVYDTNHDGKPDLVGYHSGSIREPYRFDKM